MDHKQLITSEWYSIADAQIKFYNIVKNYANNKTKEQVCKELGISKRRLSQILSGDFNGSLANLIGIANRAGFIASINFIGKEEFIKIDEDKYVKSKKS